MIVFVIYRPTCDLWGLYNMRSCQGNEFSCRGTQSLGQRRTSLLSVQNFRVLLSQNCFLSPCWGILQSTSFRTFFFLWRCDPTRVMASSFLRFLDHTQRHTPVGRTPLDEWSARRRDLYLTTYNTHNRQTSMPQVGFEPTISAAERPQTCTFDRAATGTGLLER